jgi:transcriptional regulator with XRE-family HTH domain
MAPTLGQRLRALRIERGLSQADLAGDLVSPSYVSLIESDRRSPDREVLDGLARRLGCSAFYLESGVQPAEITEHRLQLQFAEIALANGALTEARTRFTELSRLTTSTEIRHGATWGLARTEEALGNLHAALDQMEGLLDGSRSGEPGAPSLLALLLGRCRIYRTAGDFARSIEVGESALEEVRQLGLDGSEDEVKLASTLVSSYWSRGDLFSAQHLASEVIERANKLGSPAAQGAAYWNACLVAEARGQLTLALDLARKSLALMSESSLSLNLAGLRVTYAWLLLRCEPPEAEQAEALLARAHEVLTEGSDNLTLACCETEQARCALLRGAVDEAAQIAEQAIARCNDSAAVELENAIVVSALALIMAGEIDGGAAAIAAAADRMEAMGSHREAGQAWRELAEALLQQGRPEQAIAAFRRAADCVGARSTTIRSGLFVPATD